MIWTCQANQQVRTQKARARDTSQAKNITGRQLARVVFSSTQEIVAETLYPGNRHSCKVLKEMVKRMEEALCLDTPQKRNCVRLRLDGGFGTDEKINHGLFFGYQLLAKMFNGNRAKVLAKSVKQWIEAPTQTQKENGQPSTRHVGWVKKKKRYMRSTRQTEEACLKAPSAKITRD